jgi:hypothetical protein
MALLLDDLREQSTRLAAIVRDLEVEVAKAMTEDDVRVPGLWVERYRGTERKAWQHADWQRDVRRQALRKHGLLGAQGIVNADGEVVDAAEVLHTLLAEVQSVHGSAAPKTRGGLAAFGLDPRDYCESSPGAWHVRVHRQADETPPGANIDNPAPGHVGQAERLLDQADFRPEGGQTDAA